MEAHAKKSFLAGIPAWALALFTLIGATIVMFVLAPGIGEAVSYTLNGLFIAVGCYFISKRNPGRGRYHQMIESL